LAQRGAAKALLGEQLLGRAEDPLLGGKPGGGRHLPASVGKEGGSNVCLDARAIRASGQTNPVNGPWNPIELFPAKSAKPASHRGFLDANLGGLPMAARIPETTPWRWSAPCPSSSPMPSPRTSSARSTRVLKRPA